MFNSSLWTPIDNTSVFSKFIPSPCCLKASFHSSSDSFNSSLSSATMVRSSAYRSFRLMSFIDTFLLISSITTMNSRGLRALPCLRPMFTLNFSAIPAPMMTLSFVCSYVASTILTSASGTPSQRNVANTISLDTVLNAFSRSTKPIHMLPCFLVSSPRTASVWTTHPWFLSPVWILATLHQSRIQFSSLSVHLTLSPAVSELDSV